MAKNFLGGLGAGKQTAGAPGSAPTPAMDAQKLARLSMAQDFLSAGLSGAASSGDPLAAGLAPLVGAMMGRNISDRQTQITNDMTAAMTGDLLGEIGGDPSVGKYLEILNNPNVPQHLRSIAQTMINRKLAPPRAAGSPPQRRTREDVNGILRYMDTGEQVFPGVTKQGSEDTMSYNEALAAILEAESSPRYIGMEPAEMDEAMRNDPRLGPAFTLLDGMSGPPQAPPPTTTAPTQPTPPDDGWITLDNGVRIRQVN